MEGTDRGDREGAGDQRRGLVVCELHDRPFVDQVGAEIGDEQGAVRRHPVPYGVLYEGVGHQNEVRGQPAAEGHACDGSESQARGHTPVANHQHADERALEQEGDHAFQRQRLADDVAGVVREGGPVGPELELHGDAGDHAPTAKVSAKMRVQNRAAAAQAESPACCARQVHATRNHASLVPR